MTMRGLAVSGLAIVLVLCISTGAGISAKKPDQKTIRYEAITIKGNQPETVFQGNISPEQFQKWFKSDYVVGGERIEVPKDATLFGTLVLTDGQQILVMPFYTWGDEKHKDYRCQGFEVGKAPAFAVSGQSEKVFLQSMKKRLETLE
jgi:hypothetical protein